MANTDGSDFEEPDWRDEISLTLLLRIARRAYIEAIGNELWEVGIEDMPRNGPLLLRAVASGRRPAEEILRSLHVSKQAVSQLIDTLALRGYLVRSVDEEDRRRIKLELTPRGELAAATTAAATESIDERLLAAVGPAAFQTTRATLIALAEMTHRHGGDGADD